MKSIKNISNKRKSECIQNAPPCHISTGTKSLWRRGVSDHIIYLVVMIIIIINKDDIDYPSFIIVHRYSFITFSNFNHRSPPTPQHQNDPHKIHPVHFLSYHSSARSHRHIARRRNLIINTIDVNVRIDITIRLFLRRPIHCHSRSDTRSVHLMSGCILN